MLSSVINVGHWMPELPMTAAQKIKRNKLREAYLGEQEIKGNEEGKRRT